MAATDASEETCETTSGRIFCLDRLRSQWSITRAHGGEGGERTTKPHQKLREVNLKLIQFKGTTIMDHVDKLWPIAAHRGQQVDEALVNHLWYDEPAKRTQKPPSRRRLFEGKTSDLPVT